LRGVSCATFALSPILDKDTLRALNDQQFYSEFCVPPADGIQEYWRSGGVTGQPLFYPRSFRDMEFALLSFARTYDCAGAEHGDRAHISFPMGIHPVGQVFARCAASRGITVNWAGSGASTPSALQLELIQRLKPTIWLGMSSYALHLANLAEAKGMDLSSVKRSKGTERVNSTPICSSRPTRASLKKALSMRTSSRANGRRSRIDLTQVVTNSTAPLESCTLPLRCNTSST